MLLRKFAAFFLSLSLCWTTVACGGPSTVQTSPQETNTNTPSAVTQLSDGQYPVQQATYDDGSGDYTLMLLNTAAGEPSTLTTADLQMARLTDEAIANGERTYLEVKGDQGIMYLTEDFRIEYVHNVTETQVNPQTGQAETVVVRRESNFWTPFAGALAGQAVGSLLFSPRYYVPPIYQRGGPLTGYGGYGRTYGQAVDRYQERYRSAAAAVTNRQTLRTAGRLRNNTRGFSRNGTRATGSGFGGSNLRSSGRLVTTPRSRSFGSGLGRPRVRSFGGRRSGGFGRRR